ncbi:hypothetical protein [Listeria grayi]|nr:hypothetical protein [Listeria grayi]
MLIIDKIQNYILRRKQVIHEKKILAIFGSVAKFSDKLILR